MNITDLFPSLRTYKNRLAQPKHLRMRHQDRAQNLSHTKKGPGRKHQQGKPMPHVNPFAALAGL